MMEFYFRGRRRRKFFRRIRYKSQTSFFLAAPQVEFYVGINSTVLLEEGGVRLGFDLPVSKGFAHMQRPVIEVEDNAELIFKGDCWIGPGCTIKVKKGGRLVFGKNVSIAHNVQIIASEKRQNEQITQLSAMVAHDIRSPLSALEVAVTLLQKDDEISRILGSATKRIRDIANKLSRKKSKLQDFVRSSENPATIVERMMSEFRLRFHDRSNLHFDSKIAAQVRECVVNFDISDFERILANLVDNSVEAMPNGGKIEVIMSAVSDEIKLEIHDQGIGIAPEFLTRVTEKGFTMNKPQGSGLGLYHAEECIKRWHGRFSIESRLGSGTSIVIYLPGTRTSS